MIQLTLNLPTQSPAFLQWLQKLSQKSQNNFCLLCISKEESRTVNYGTTQNKSRRRLKGPRRPTEPSDPFDFEKAAAFPLFPPRTTVHIASEEAAHYN